MLRKVLNQFHPVGCLSGARERPYHFEAADGFLFPIMGLYMTSRVWRESKQSGSNLLLLMALADFSDDDGVCFPAVDTLAKKSRMTPRNVRRVLRQLEEDGELSCEPNAGPKGVNVYRVTPGGADKLSGDTGSAPPLTLEVQPPDAGVLQTVMERSKESSRVKEDSVSLEAQGFVEAFLKLLTDTGAAITPPTPAIRTRWALTYDRLLRIDGKTKEQVWAVCKWARNDRFWRGNFFSPVKLREKDDGGVTYFDRFSAKMNQPNNGNAQHQQTNGRNFEQSGIDEIRAYEKRLAAGEV